MTPLYTDEEFLNAKSLDFLKLKCEHCGKEFYVQKKYIVHEIKKTKGHLRFCSKSCSVSQNNKNRVLSTTTKDKISKSITNYHRLNGRIGKPKKEKKEKIVIGCKQNVSRENALKERTCKVCGRIYTLQEENTSFKTCSCECRDYLLKHPKEFLEKTSLDKMSKSGRKSIEIQGNSRRSKNEIYFCELCEKYFNNVKHNTPLFNGWDADIIIEDIKTAILWNGKWHYEKITKKHSVEQVQNRDKIRIDEIIKMGYTPYVIKDMGKYNPEFVEEKFNEFIRRDSPVG